MTTTAPVRSPSRAIANGANSGSGASTGSCQDCVKTGLAILPVVAAVAHNSLKPSLPGLDKWLSAADLQEHWYFMRSLPVGYLYVLRADKSGNAPALGGWDAYVVDADGLLRKVAPGTQPEHASDLQPMTEACKRKGDNVPAQVIAVDPVAHPKVWMAFSRYRWTTDVLSSHAKNTDGCRTARMREVDVTAAAAGQLGQGTAVPYGMKMGPKISEAVADYAPNLQRLRINQSVTEPVRGRAEQVEALVKAMAQISDNTPAKVGAVIVLSDAVGVTEELNLRRSRLAAEAAATAGLGDADRSRRRVVAEVIEGIRLSALKNPGPWWDKNYGPERFLKHIDQGAWAKAKEEDKKFKDLLAQIDKFSADFVAVKEGALWQAQQRGDFDPQNEASALNHGNMVARCVAGSGLTKVEREKVWLPVIEATVAAPDNWLDRALVALHPEAVTYIAQDSQQDKAYDLVKGAAAISRELTSTGVEQLSKLHTQMRIKRAANQATAALIESAAAQLYRLRLSNPDAHFKLMRKVAVALLVRDGQLAQPKVVTGPFEKIAQWIQEIAFGPPRKAAMPIGVRPDLNNYDAYKAVKGNLGDEGWRLSQAMEGAIVFDAPKTQGKNGEVVAWVITRVGEGATLDRTLLARLGLQNIDLNRPLPAATVNPFLEASLKRTAGRSDVLLGAGVLFFQTNSFVSALTDYKTKTATADKIGGGVGMLTAVLSASSAGLEIYVAVQTLRGVEKARLVGPQVWAARLSLWAGMAEGAFLIYKGVDKRSGGDVDSGWWTIGSGVTVVAAGIAGYGAGMAVAGGLAGSASSATVLGISLGPIGWALLAIAFIGAAIYFSWQAFATDDDNLLPVEYWLDNGVFGRRKFTGSEVGMKNPFYKPELGAVPAFADAGTELGGLQRVTLVAQGTIKGTRDRGGYGVMSFYKVVIPRFVSGSSLEVKFIAIKNNRRRDGGGFICEDGKAKVISNTISRNFTGMREAPKIEIDAENGVMRVEGWFATLQEEPSVEKFVEWVAGKDNNPNALYADRIEMQVFYKPDRVNLPELVSELKDIN